MGKFVLVWIGVIQLVVGIFIIGLGVKAFNELTLYYIVCRLPSNSDFSWDDNRVEIKANTFGTIMVGILVGLSGGLEIMVGLC